jgi:hypothetical protein
MRIFNRIVVILLLAGLFVLGVFTVLYAFDIGGYRLADLPNTLGLNDFYDGVRVFVGDVEGGDLNILKASGSPKGTDAAGNLHHPERCQG